MESTLQYAKRDEVASSSDFEVVRYQLEMEIKSKRSHLYPTKVKDTLSIDLHNSSSMKISPITVDLNLIGC